MPPSHNNIIMVGLERMLDCRGVGLERFHCMSIFHFGNGFGDEASPMHIPGDVIAGHDVLYTLNYTDHF